jgi:hypothetical protein
MPSILLVLKHAELDLHNLRVREKIARESIQENPTAAHLRHASRGRAQASRHTCHRSLCCWRDPWNFATLDPVNATDYLPRPLTANECAMIRSWRCDGDNTWRAVASLWADYEGETGSELGGNQLIGMALCEAAAQHYGEDYMQGRWN